MTIPKDLIIERLQDVYDRAINARDRRDFFLSLFEYIAIYDEEPILEEVIKDIVSKGKQEIKEQSELGEKALAEIRAVYKEVKNYIEKENVANSRAIDNLNQFTAHEDGSLTTSAGPIKGRYDYLSYVLMVLAEDESANYLPFVRKFGDVTDERRIKKWHFSPSYELWEQESNRLDRIMLTRVWYSWDRLALFYFLYRDYEKMIKTRLESNQVWDALNLSALFGEIKDIVAGKKTESGYIEFQESEFKTHLQRFYSYTKQYLVSVQDESKAQTATALLDDKRFKDQEVPKSIKSPPVDLPLPDEKKELRWRDLTLNLGKGTISFKANKTIDVSPKNKEIKFLQFLMEKNGNIAEYVDIAKHADFNSCNEDSSNDDPTTCRAVQDLFSKGLKGTLKRAGMKDTDIDDYILNVPGSGYKLV